MGSQRPGPEPRERGITPAARARLLLFFAAALFGLLAVLARLASLEGLSAPQVATVRFAVGTAVSLALFRVRPGTFRPVRRGLLVTPRARSRCQVGRSPRVKYEMATAMTGKVLLRSVACPAGMSERA
jgi:hypothetical protein